MCEYVSVGMEKKLLCCIFTHPGLQVCVSQSNRQRVGHVTLFARLRNYKHSQSQRKVSMCVFSKTA